MDISVRNLSESRHDNESSEGGLATQETHDGASSPISQRIIAGANRNVWLPMTPYMFHVELASQKSLSVQVLY